MVNVKVKITLRPTGSRPVCLSAKPHLGAQDHIFFLYSHTVAGLFMQSALSDERTDLSFTLAVGPRQCSHIYRGQAAGFFLVRFTLRLAVYGQSVRLDDKPLETHDK
jgi:hypothetical protein